MIHARSFIVQLVVATALAACGSKAASHPATAPVVGERPAPAIVDAGAVAVAPAAAIDAAPTPEPAALQAARVAAEIAAYQDARPAFDRYCARCHQQGGKGATAKKLAHLDITTYPFTGHHAHELGSKLRRVLAIGGGKATMPKDKPGSVTADDLARFAKLADAWDQAHANDPPAPDDDDDDDD